MQPRTNERKKDFMARCQRAGNTAGACEVMFAPEQQKQMEWKRIDQQRRGHLSNASQKFREALRGVYADAVDALGRYSSPSEIKEIPIKRAKLEEAYLDVWPRVGSAFAVDAVQSISRKSKRAEIRAKNVEGMDPEEMRDYFSTVIADSAKSTIENRVKLTSETARKDLQSVIDRAIKEGLGIEKTRRLIEKVGSEQIAPKRGRRIARTEIISASNMGSLTGAKSTSVELKKEYLATRDGRTRAGIDSVYDHLTPDGQRVALDEYFSVSGESLQYPGDPAGSPGNIINCRCTQTYEPVD